MNLSSFPISDSIPLISCFHDHFDRVTVLMTFPFDRVKPKLIAVEVSEGNEERAQYRKDLESFLDTKGYKICKYCITKTLRGRFNSSLVCLYASIL
jgi:hypothetical protein